MLLLDQKVLMQVETMGTYKEKKTKQNKQPKKPKQPKNI